MKILLSIAILSVCLFAQGDGFTSTSGFGFGSDGSFALGMETRPPSGSISAERTIDIVDETGKPIFPKQLTFAGTFTFRPTPNHEAATLARIWIVAGTNVMIFNQNLTAINEGVNIAVPQQTWKFPPPLNGTPLRMFVLIGTSGKPAPVDAELELAGQWE